MKRICLALALMLCMVCCGAAAEVEMTIEYVTPKPTPIYEADLSEYNILELTLLQLNVEEAIRQIKKATPTPAPNSHELGIWELQYYIDEFKMPTDKAYIRNAERIRGTFSNSATDNSRLDVRFLVDKDKLTFMLYEYGSSLVKNSYSSDDEDYYVLVLDPNGVKHKFFGYIPPNGDRVHIYKDAYGIRENEADLLNILKQGGKINFYIEESDRSKTNYNFVIEDESGFDVAYEHLLTK